MQVTDADVIGAMRLGLEVANDDRTAVQLVRHLLELAPPTSDGALEPTRLLIDVVRERGEWTLVGS